MVHEDLKDMKLKVPPDDTTLTMRDAVTRMVQWRTSIDVDPSAPALASTTVGQPNTAPALLFPETCSSLSPIREEPRLSPIQEQSWKYPPQT
jgi:hypothetical protein